MKKLPRVFPRKPSVAKPASETAVFAAENHANLDNRAVSSFSYAMRVKLAAKRLEGRGGWQDKEQCSNEYLSQLLREHVEKGDPVDVANFAMMLHQRGERISPSPVPIVMGVKPLEWTTAALQHSYGLVIRIGQTPFGAYHILKGRQGKFEVYFTTVPLSGAIDDEAEALAWAQSDYERRIRAALPSPMEGGE